MSKLLQITGSLVKYRVVESPTTEQCVRHAGNPLQAFLLLWRTTKVTYTPPSQEPTVHWQVWPSKVRLLLLHWRSLPAATRSLWTRVFPASLLAELALPEEAEYTMGGVLGLINLYTVYSLRIQGVTEYV